MDHMFVFNHALNILFMNNAMLSSAVVELSLGFREPVFATVFLAADTLYCLMLPRFARPILSVLPGGSVAAAPPPVWLDDPALCGSRPLVTL